MPSSSQLLVTDDDVDGCPKSVLGKAQLLLAAFGAGASRLRLTELSRRSGVPKATAYRIAQELTLWGLLERVGESYQLGVRVFELGQRVPLAASLRALARPMLVDLFAASRATIHLAVLDEMHVLYVEKIAGAANIHTHSQVGARLPATCTATGKALLAFAPDADAILDRDRHSTLARPTSRSTTSIPAVKLQLADVRRRGFAVEAEETVTGFGSVAVPVRGADGVVHAAISATTRIDQLVINRLVPQLIATASAIARAIDQDLLSGDRYTRSA